MDEPSPTTPSAPTKIVVHFRATGSAPILKQQFFKISASYKFQAVVDFLKKQLAMGPGESLFLYVNSAFSPAPDEVVGNLHKSFQDAKGDLVINYSTVAAWG
jgi:ubiquitin-like protein ATG12